MSAAPVGSWRTTPPPEDVDFSQPVKNEQLRGALRLDIRPKRSALVEDIERWLPFVENVRKERKADRWTPVLEEMRRGLEIVSAAVNQLGGRAWEDLGAVPHTTRTGRGTWVRFFTPGEIGAAAAWLDFYLRPRRGAHRPKDVERVEIGDWLANIFRQHGERVTLGRSGAFAEALRVVLESLGYKAPEDPLPLLRRIRELRSRRHPSHATSWHWVG